MSQEENKLTATEENKLITIIGINFREAGKIYYFDPKDYRLKVGQRVIAETAKGTEIGTVKIANKQIPESEVSSPLKPILRPANEDDLLRDEGNKYAEIDAALIFKKKVAQHKLAMNVVAAEYTFDNSKLTFYFTCESRVDFRELVKDLASTFRTRIELRQIGIRDETKMMGGIGICGRKYCCSGFLTDFVQVSIKMAKEQNFSLNSSKASGTCGRLMCCLRYEHETYEELLKTLPPVGSVVQTKDGVGTVVELKVIAEELRVKIEGNEKDAPKCYKNSDIKVIKLGGKHENHNNDEQKNA